jgi:hypothetical protein
MECRITELEAINRKGHEDYRIQVDAIVALQARLEAVKTGYAEAIEDIEDWGVYASEYFQEKHDLAGTLAAHRKALEESK